jgi:hypothetical protein
MSEKSVLVGTRKPVRRHLDLDKDIRILELIRDSSFISHAQIYSLVGFGEVRSQRYYRLKKLVDLEMISEHPAAFPYRGNVYSISSKGILCLEACGLGVLSLTPDSEIITDPRQIYHFLGLNQVRIRFQNSFTVLTWLPDLVLKSNNLVSGIKPTAKDYDAVAEFELTRGKVVRIGVEYERTLKSKERYAEIRKYLNGEDSVSGVIYFVESEAAALFLVQHVYSPKVPIAIVTTSEFLSQEKNAAVRIARENKIVAVRLDKFISEI